MKKFFKVLVPVVSFVFALSLMGCLSARDRLPAPVVSLTDIGEENRVVSWTEVPGAVGYVVYAFNAANQTNPRNAYRSQFVTGTQITIGWGDSQPHTVANWGADITQGFDLPLPFRFFHFRVVAVAEDPAGNSRISNAVNARPGARIVNAPQTLALIEDAKRRFGANAGMGHIAILIGLVQPTDALGPGTILIPILQSSADYFNEVSGHASGRGSEGNRAFVDRAAMETRAHPSYNGPETVIFVA